MTFCTRCGMALEPGQTECPHCSSRSQVGTTVAPRGPQESGVCPACGAVDDYHVSLAFRGSFSWLAFFLGGILAVLFRNASREKRVQCNACGELFGIRTPLSKVYLVLFWILIGPAVIALALGVIVLVFGK